MKSLYISLIILITTCYCGFAQVAFGLHSTQLPYFPFNIAKSETLDSVAVSVSYKATYLDYSVKDEETKVDDIMCLQLGQNVSKFFSTNLDNLDRFKTFKEKRTAKMRQNYLPYIIYRNEGEICVVNREPFEVRKSSLQTGRYLMRQKR